MEKHKPVEQAEFRFLHHEDDLMALPNRSQKARIHLDYNQHALVVLLLLPFVAYLFVPGFFARLTILIMASISGLIVLSFSGLAARRPKKDRAVGVTM